MRFPGAYRKGAFLVVAAAIFSLVHGIGQGAYLDRELKEARERAVMKDFEGALDIYDFIIEEDPENLEALNGKAKVLAWMGKYDRARSTYREVLRLDPHNIESLTGMADTYSWEGDYNRAISLMEKEQGKTPGEKEILIRLARYNLKTNRREEAIYYANKVLEDDPRDGDALEVREKAEAIYRYETFFGYYYLNINNDPNGNNLYGGLRYRPGNRYSLFGRIDLLDRFNRTEGRLLGGGTFKLTDNLQLSSELGISPDADIFPIAAGWAELASPALSSWVIFGSLNFSHYREADLYGLSITGQYYPYGYISILTRFTLSRIEFERGGGSTDGAISLEATWFIGTVNEIHAYIAYGNEAYKPTTIDLVGNIDAKIIGIGGTYFFNPGWGIVPSLEYLDKKSDTRYIQLGIELLHRW